MNMYTSEIIYQGISDEAFWMNAFSNALIKLDKRNNYTTLVTNAAHVADLALEEFTKRFPNDNEM